MVDLAYAAVLYYDTRRMFIHAPISAQLSLSYDFTHAGHEAKGSAVFGQH